MPIPTPCSRTQIRLRTALIASADNSFRRRLCDTLTELRWTVHEANGGAEAWCAVEAAAPEAVIVDSWLPDLDHDEFLRDLKVKFPAMDVIVAGCSELGGDSGPHRQELLYALHRSEDAEATNAEMDLNEEGNAAEVPGTLKDNAADPPSLLLEEQSPRIDSLPLNYSCVPVRPSQHVDREPVSQILPEFIGTAPCMAEVSRRIRLVAPRSTPVLIEGPTGSGKELVAQALHRLSARSKRPFIAINCAAIPEGLLEAELFGHTRGAFTGAVQGRTGKIEAADGGTLFLDEIGEMPLSLQAKLLRFVECGELQRVGDNATVRVDVRIVAATHRPLAQHTQTGAFRSDLYYRLAVFLIRTPALAEHMEDLSLLVEHFLGLLGRRAPIKQLDPGAFAMLASHTWPGNVRELEHLLERASILAGDQPRITAGDIDFGPSMNGPLKTQG